MTVNKEKSGVRVGGRRWGGGGEGEIGKGKENNT